MEDRVLERKSRWRDLAGFGEPTPCARCLANPSGGGRIVWELLSERWGTAAWLLSPVAAQLEEGASSVRRCGSPGSAPGQSPASSCAVPEGHCLIGNDPECLKEMKHPLFHGSYGSGSGLPLSFQRGAEEPLPCVAWAAIVRSMSQTGGLGRQAFMFSRFQRLRAHE